jgi:hypothetical protein
MTCRPSRRSTRKVRFGTELTTDFADTLAPAYDSLLSAAVISNRSDL